MTYSFDPRGSLIVVPATLYLGKRPETVRLGLDTGATRTVISRQIALHLGYEPAESDRRTRIITGSGAISVPLLKIDRLEALGKALTNVPVLCHTLPSRAAIDGVLGLDFLRGRRLTIDFRAGQLALE